METWVNIKLLVHTANQSFLKLFFCRQRTRPAEPVELYVSTATDAAVRKRWRFAFSPFSLKQIET